MLFALSSALGFALMGFCVNECSGALPPGELAFLRGLFAVVILLPWCARDLGALARREGRWLWVRSASGAGSVLCYFHTLQHTAIATARALADMAPVFVCILAWVFGHERPARAQVAVIALMTAAAVSLGATGIAELTAGTAAVGLFGAASAGFAYISLRRAALAFRNELVVFALGAGLVISAPFMPGPAWVWPPLQYAPAVVGVVALGLAAQLLFTRGFLHLSASVASGFSVTALLWSVVLQVALQGDRPTAAAAAAYAVIMVGAAALHVVETRRGSAQPAQDADV